MSARPVLTRDGDTWIPEPEAKGPFPGQHGGSIVGAMASAMEAVAREREAGQPVSLHANFLRAVPMEPVAVRTEVVREGGRVLVLAAELRAEGKVSALARAVFGQHRGVPGLADPEFAPAAPETHPAADFRPRVVEGTWLGDACEFRWAEDGTVWMRLIRPLAVPETPLATVACLADFSTGISKPDGWEKHAVGNFPNLDLTIHMARLPDLPAGAGWLGVQCTPLWYSHGLGVTSTALHDRLGRFGHAVQAVVLDPVEGVD